MTFTIVIPTDPTMLGDDATSSDVRAFVAQLAVELAEETGETVDGQAQSTCARSTVLGPVGEARDRLRDRLREVLAGDEWIQVLARAVPSNVTDEQIAGLRDAAGCAGDSAQVALCTAALAGDVEARRRCAQAIDAAQAMA
jgi:hypothetical protein